MSFALAARAAPLVAARRAPAGARAASSAAYLQAYEFDFFDKMKFEGCRSRFNVSHEENPIDQFPRMVRNILRLEKAMERKGMTPLVHASPQAMKIPRQGHEGRFRKTDATLDEVKGKVDAGYAAGKKDMDPAIRPHVMSASYALCSSVAIADSAWYHAMFLNARPDIRATMIHAIKHAYSHYPKEAVDAYIHDVLMHLFRGYASLPVGEFTVFGIKPEEMEHIYDCKAWGVPTGHDAKAIAKDPTSCPRLKHGHQVRIYQTAHKFLTLSPHDEEAVDAFCTEEDEPTDPCFEPFFKHDWTHVEEEQIARQKELDERAARILTNHFG